MRINSTNLRCTSVLVAALIIGVLGGCGEQAQDVDEEMPVITDDLEPDNGDAAPDGTASQDVPDDAETMADVVGSFTMPTSFRMTVEDEQGTAQTMAMKMDGEQATKMRVEHEAPEGAQVMIMDFEGGQMVSYDPSANEGFSMPVSDEEAADAPMPWDDYEETAEIVGSEEINGVDTWIVETGPEGPEGETATVWIGKDDGLIRQVRQGEETLTFTISDVNSVPDDAFEVPDDVEISDMPAPTAPQGAE